MRIIRTTWIPNGTKGINLFGILFVRPTTKITDVDFNHESIHTAQMKELLYVPFYLWYGIEWVVRFIGYSIKNRKIMGDKAYKNISFEREAFENDDNILYLDSRESFSFLKYL